MMAWCAAEASGEKDGDQFQGEPDTDGLAAKAQDVHVIVPRRRCPEAMPNLIKQQ